MEFEVKVHGKRGFIPQQAEPGDVGFDLHAPEDIYLPHNCRRMVDTGVIVETPEPLFSLVVPRSSTGTKRAKEVRIANTVGVIDPSYRGQDDTLGVCLVREARKKEFIGTFTPDRAVNKSLVRQALDYFGIQNHHGVTTEGNRTTVPGGPMLSHRDLKLVLRSDGDMDVFGYESDPDESHKIFEKGDRFVQVVFIPFSRPQLLEKALEEFGQEGRGGFGSTGK